MTSAPAELHRATAADPSFDDRLVAESVRLIEQDSRELIDEPAAIETARKRSGDLETRIITRAANLSDAPQLRSAVERLSAGITWVIALGLLVAFLLGAATVRTTMAAADGTRINFYWVLGGVLAVQSILLLIWLIVAAHWRVRMARSTHRRTESPMLVSLGRLVVALGQWIGTKLQTQSHGRAVMHAAGTVLATGRIGFWTFSSITHALWLSFNIGALTLVLLLLSARQYTFVWETTILSERHYITMTQWLSAPARLAGFAVPTHEDIERSQWRGEMPAPLPSEPDGASDGRSQRWASLLVASIVLYGFGPRLLLLGLSMSMRRSACRSYRLDTTLPEYERLRNVLMPPAQSMGVIDRDDGSAINAQSPETAIAGRSQPRPSGPPAIGGIELPAPQHGWPPRLCDRSLTDLGMIESRDDRDRLVQSLRASEHEPDPLVLVCNLTTTPDRGIGRTLARLREAVTRSPVLLLTGGQSLRDRGYDASRIEQRVMDWRELAASSGIDEKAIIELDLDHLTPAATAKLRPFLHSDADSGAADGRDAPSRRIETAFSLIEQHAREWLGRNRPPGESDQLKLHNEIAALYRHVSGSFRSLLALKPGSPGEMLNEIKTGAVKFIDLLPDRLRRSPKWLAAGAMAGALGCIASAALISPLAIAALPSWSAIGAAIGAAIQPSSAGGNGENPLPDSPDVAGAVRAAALFAVTLQLQGRDEAAITRALDTAFADDEARLSTAETIRDWLNAVRHRFDLAMEAHR
jgi:hypothetical protein